MLFRSLLTALSSAELKAMAAARPAYGLVPQPVSRILSGAANGAVIFISLGAPEDAASPGCRLAPTPRNATNPGLSDGPPSPLFSLAPDWVFRAAVVAFGAVGSYPTFSPLP